MAGIPAGPNTEVLVASHRCGGKQDFGDEDRELAGHIAAAVGQFSRRLTLALGFGPD